MISFNNIAFNYGQDVVLNGVDLVANTGEITCLLGASGSGKSTLLRLAMGTEKTQQGEILINDRLLCNSSVNPTPEKRPIGMMFQENALFPNMNIAQNIAFGLRGYSKKKQQSTVSKMLQLVDMAGFEKRYPASLSGGQQQRVALARSLAPNPQVLLMDEPYANIDILLRRSLRESARMILKNNNTTTILVTHDPQEAIEMADKIAVLSAGKIVQCNTPQVLYEKPKTTAVASLFADAQIVSAAISERGYVTKYGTIEHSEKNSKFNKCNLAIRPNGVGARLCDKGEFKIVDIRFVGHGTQLYIQANCDNYQQDSLCVAAESGTNYKIGDKIALKAKRNGFFIFNDISI